MCIPASRWCEFCKNFYVNAESGGYFSMGEGETGLHNFQECWDFQVAQQLEEQAKQAEAETKFQEVDRGEV